VLIPFTFLPEAGSLSLALLYQSSVHDTNVFHPVLSFPSPNSYHKDRKNCSKRRKRGIFACTTKMDVCRTLRKGEKMIRLLTDSMLKFLTKQPAASADVKGSEKYPDIRGLVAFYPFENGTVVLADICGLPQTEEPCGTGFFGFHIH